MAESTTPNPPARPLRELLNDEEGATMLEWSLLLGVIAIPSYFIISFALAALVAHFQMVTTLVGLPMP